jgi:NADH-quinone oxidoreductase subunit A
MHSLITYITSFAPQTWALGTYVVATFAIVGLMLGLSWVLGGRDHGRHLARALVEGVRSILYG